MTQTPTIRTDYGREELIAICERGVVPVREWADRDSPGAHEKLGLCWVMLKAGCEFSVHRAGAGNSGCHTNERTIWLTIWWPNFSDFEYGTTKVPSESETFYLPTPSRLDAANGRDWY